MGKFLPGNPGRPKGALGKKKVKRVDQYFIENDINPIEQIMRELPLLEPRDRVKTMLELLTYCYAKPNQYEPLESLDENSEIMDKFKKVTDEALILIAGGKIEA